MTPLLRKAIMDEAQHGIDNPRDRVAAFQTIRTLVAGHVEPPGYAAAPAMVAALKAISDLAAAPKPNGEAGRLIAHIEEIADAALARAAPTA